MNFAERVNSLTPGARGVLLGNRIADLEGGALDGVAGIKLYVNSVTGNDDQNDGLSLYEAKATIQAAVDLAEHYSTIYIDGYFT